MTADAKTAAMQRVEEHADPTWKDCAAAAVWILAHSQERFTSADVADYVTSRWPDVHTHEQRALGPVMQNAARSQLIEKHGFDYHPAASRHQAPCQMWLSLVYTPGGGSDD